MHQQFRIKPGTFEKVRKKRLRILLPVMLLAAIAGIAISYTTSKRLPGQVNSLPIVIVCLIVAFSFAIFRLLNRMRIMYDSYLLTVTENTITRELAGSPPMTIHFFEIREISKSPQGYIIIRGREPTSIIFIPPGLERFEELEAMLRRTEPFQSHQQLSFFQRNPLILPIATMALMSIVFISFNKWLVGICGALLLIVLAVAFFSIQNYKYVNPRARRISWWYLLLALVVIFNMATKIFGFPGFF